MFGTAILGQIARKFQRCAVRPNRKAVDGKPMTFDRLDLAPDKAVQGAGEVLIK